VRQHQEEPLRRERRGRLLHDLRLVEDAADDRLDGEEDG
jgi:hypothetical protein